VRTVPILLGGLAVLAAATPALAGSGGTGSSGSGTSSTSTSCGCTPTTHQVKVPGVTVTPPSVSIGLPSVGVGYGQGTGVASASATAESNVSVTVNGSSSSSGTTTSQSASALVSSFGGGGSGSWTPEGGVSTEIPDVKIETPAPQKVCAAWAAAAQQVAIQAQCLDDKAVPHPASQTFPDRAVAQGYEGEIFRCIAGARMQYTLAEFSGQADFNHGQTLVCQKGEALWRTASGTVQCKAQAPARDCNERSLLRRFGAGIKVMAMAAQRTCTAWRTETVTASAAQSGPLVLN
jgi:hypothetical protein